ncbi:MAG: acyltransferase family protein [Actinomycetes bacterium]
MTAGGLESAAGTPVVERRFPCLDGYRAVAALTVLLSHVAFTTGRSLHGRGSSLLTHTDIGVAVFFVLSGFLLYRPMAVARLSGRPLPSVRDYLARRVLRIVPAFWVSVVFVMLVLAVNADVRGDAKQWLLHLGFAQIYTSNDRTLGLGQDWSLCAEVTFYLFLPCWPYLLRRLRPTRTLSVRAELICLAALAIGGLVWLGETHTGHGLPLIAGTWLPGHLDWFAAGMALGLVSADLKVNPHRAPRYRDLLTLADLPALCCIGAAAIYALAATALSGPITANALFTPGQALCKEVLYCGIAAVFLLPGFFGDQQRGLLRRFLRTEPMRRLGEASYGIFLLHMGAMFLAFQWLHIGYFTGGFWRILVLTLAITLPLAFASLYVVERPALRLKPPHRELLVPDSPQPVAAH